VQHASSNVPGGYRRCSAFSTCSMASESFPPDKPSITRSPGTIICHSETAFATERISFAGGDANPFAPLADESARSACISGSGSGGDAGAPGASRGGER